MTYNTPNYNTKNQPICKICEVAYDRLLLHVNKRHGLNAKEYKAKFGFNPRKGIQSVELQRAMRKAALANYDKVIMQNLIIGGISSRFKEGNIETDKARVRETSRERMTLKWAREKQLKKKSIEQLAAELARKLKNLR
ncbi:MAG TPA: hypothetical protein ENH87_11555 [Pricia antarctica]|uniref:ROS/MUCR transcriptional regulator protein n=1 Tax=Pricia antarctica TaxID=641691 RepID=A0A831VVM0_9FLAO|nr:hypothetical protein [Pricia antarctica]